MYWGAPLMDRRTISYLRPLRRRWGLTQAELASLIGTRTYVAVSRIESLKTYPSLAEAIACSIYFRHAADRALS
jgi:DNA-binding XRE family transcriptional regulator